MSERIFVCLILLLMVIFELGEAWGDKDRVKLVDVKALTLYKGQMTTSRRSHPVPQVKCVGGTAYCAFIPDVVQCTNKGSDGFDVQWECQASMEKIYRFGRIEIVCEGYDYPDDPYILRGSCGLEFTLDKRNGYNDHSEKNDWNISQPSKRGSIIGNLILLAMVALLVYGFYKTCIANHQYSSTDDDFSPHDGRSNPFGSPSAPQPPGFRSEYMPGDCSGTRYSSGSGGFGNTGGFWTGAATGGLLGYILGNRQSQPSSSYYQPPPYSGRNWGSNSSDNHGASSSTWTSSGFGGTRRR